MKRTDLINFGIRGGDKLSKATSLVKLYHQAVLEYTKNPEEWKGLLTAAARYYKRSFDNIVLVYAQRPDFTQMATFDEWHDRRINRSINKGAKGIAVIDMTNPTASFKYLFDFMDTNGSEESFRAVMKYRWELEEQYHPDIMKRFHEKYHTETSSIEACLQGYVKQRTMQLLPELEQFTVNDEKSILYGMPPDAVKNECYRLIAESVLYTVFYKCGIPTIGFEQELFENINHFNSLELFMTIGNYAVSVVRPILKEINQEIETIKKERSTVYEERAINGIAVPGEQNRNDATGPADIRESGTGQPGGREVRKDVEGIHVGELSTSPVQLSRNGENQRDDSAGRPGSGRTEGSTDTGNVKETAASRGYHGTNPEDEHHHHDGRGSDSGGIREEVPVKQHKQEEKPSVEQRKPSIDGLFSVPPKRSAERPVEEEKADSSGLLTEGELFEIVDAILCMENPVPHMKEWQADIILFFQQNESDTKREAFLKTICHGLNVAGLLSGVVINTIAQEEGLHFQIDQQSLLISYEELADRIEQLILEGIYPREEDDIFDDFSIPDEMGKEPRLSDMERWEEEQTGRASWQIQLNLFDAFQEEDEAYELEDGDGVDARLEPDHMKPGDLVRAEHEDSLSDRQTAESDEADVELELNYRFSEEHHLYEGGAKTKCRNNIAAIRLLKDLQEQGRAVTQDEQIVLARFVGWGGLANALTPGKSGWETEYGEIKSLLTEDEFLSAQQSTTTAYYTEQSIISSIYAALGKLGFQSGNILDPAMGTGNFYSVLPGSMEASQLYGVELDTISGDIARQLYPTAEIQVKGFEDCDYPDQFFDVVIGNIPFNDIRVSDRRYDRYRFKIHDYFLAKSLDKTRPGGIVAVITSKYTLDKANQTNRKYLAQRAELLGAIRLPNNAFKAVAGTEATADILFLKKREREIVPDEENSPWLSIEENKDGIPMNSYFIDHPEMVLGTMVFDESMFGNAKTTACHPNPEDDLQERLEQAVFYLEGTYEEATSEYAEEKTVTSESLPASPDVRNFSYAVIEDTIYFQEHSRMYRQDISGKKAERIQGMVELTGIVRDLIAFQSDPNYQEKKLSSSEYEAHLQTRLIHLNQTYDRFVAANGFLNSRANVAAYARDSNAPLLRSIEEECKEQKGVYEKTAMFFKATIKPKAMPTVVFSAEEALKVSLNMKGSVDLQYMSLLYYKPENNQAAADEIIEELGNRIYQDPAEYSGDPYGGWKTAEEYLSGYVKDKLAEAMLKAEQEPERFARNVAALREVQPTPLTPEEISFSLGSTWIPEDVYEQFMYDTMKTMLYNRNGYHPIQLEFSKYSAAYFITNKGNEKTSVTVNQTYGTERMNAYEILESSLNLRSVEVKDRVDYVDPATGEDKVRYVLNKAETILAREKQAQLKLQFESWLFADPERGARLTDLYNERFNNIRPRTYNGDDLILPDINEEIALRKHQRDVVAMGIYSDGNLLMAHEVGAGKTFSSIVLTYELKRLGRIHKPLFAVPNHLVGQWADEYMKLYPRANILVAEKRDFERKNRRRFASRIATGDYDAIIMAHSSFELIGLSRERQIAAMRDELEGISVAISEEKSRNGTSWSLKQMQIFRKNLQFRYDRLYNAEKKDDVINFEELGVDCLVVDEAHVYKNNFSYTKMRNVAGVSGQSSQRAMDMHMKAQYINEIGNGKGVIYLTGTPISNSMAELYVMQKTLQPRELDKRGLLMFDAWASTFGKVETSLEIKPEGNGYQMKNRFARFHNIPELMGIFRVIANIKTADMLDLPVPRLKDGKVQMIKTQITPEQKQMVMELGERAEAIRDGRVDSSEDNFLKLTHEARLLAVDPRAVDSTLPDDSETKLNICARNAADIYHQTEREKSTQLIFCDQGTPKYDGSYNFYEALKEALLRRGVKEDEMAFIHDAKSDVQREILFENVQNGRIRILIGSTEKMGTGMNVQDKLIALHHLDVPWRPSDLIQRNGRILRQGNTNEEISIFNYITENTFDAYLWQILEQKQRYISQIMTGRSALRSCEDMDDTVLQYAEFKALATSDPRIKEKMETDNEISRLTVLKSAWQNERNQLQEKVTRSYPREIERGYQKLEGLKADFISARENLTGEFSMELEGRIHTERTKAAEHFMVLARRLGKSRDDAMAVGCYAGFPIRLVRTMFGDLSIQLKGNQHYSADLGESELGNITRIEKLVKRIKKYQLETERDLQNLEQQLGAAKAQLSMLFPNEARLAELQKRKVELDLALEFRTDGEDALGDGEKGTDTDTSSLTLEQVLYRKLCVFAEPIFHQAYYMRLEALHFDKLVIENIGDGEYSIAHYYEKNGDAMRAPEITFCVDEQNKAIYPTSYLQDDMGIFYEVENVKPAQVKDLKLFMSQWFTNIKEQGFELTKMEEYEEETEDDEYAR